MARSPKTNLLELPVELIALIFTYLDDEDVFAGRLANKALEEASFALFGKRFFRKKGFMVTSLALECLRSIADHQKLRKYIQHIWFNPDCFTFARPECAPDDEDSDMDDADELITPFERDPEAPVGEFDKLARQYEAYRQVMRDHAQLLHTNKLETTLAAIMGKLPNITTIGMRRSEEYSPYGWSILQDAVGEDPRVLGPIPSGPVYSLSGPTNLFIAIIKATANAKVSLERLYTDAIEIDNVRDDLPHGLSQATLDAACSSVLYIELNAVKGWLNTRWELASQPYNTLRRPEDFGSGLTRLLKATCNLKELGLQIFPDRKQSHLLAPSARNPDSWRLSYPYVALQRLSSAVSLSNLTRVKLEKVTTTSATLKAFLMPCAKNLESLKIRDVRLLSSAQTSPTNPAVFATYSEDEERPWQTFFSFLLGSCPGLSYILFHHLMHARGTILFTEETPPPMPAEELDFLINHVPPSYGESGLFTKSSAEKGEPLKSFEDLTVELVEEDQILVQANSVAGQTQYAFFSIKDGVKDHGPRSAYPKIAECAVALFESIYNEAVRIFCGKNKWIFYVGGDAPQILRL
ncbi:uncharacterized protein MYCFIDRAFT_78962 [Pseudocercospora fijiensis CIRAD86]|uniref:F-box domain-containing protein n=1 Tax=Pseudocercospora fijiensis (strain CIRAD86) TaxID=383855 RepID=M3AAE4_PSEFD|nr:uncharacterized protein MYCFIDRAFT_78962 [Pseudocercospora fijiensis CIRAD86]EME81576.1 hypothetical protein MYCFIDRAFT_78962 [Pseudocercospora fijiensis CIRAD86]